MNSSSSSITSLTPSRQAIARLRVSSPNRRFSVTVLPLIIRSGQPILLPASSSELACSAAVAKVASWAVPAMD